MRALLACTLLVAMLAGCVDGPSGGPSGNPPVDGSPAAGGEKTVRLTDTVFTPTRLSVAVDTVVVFHNFGSLVHTATVAADSASPAAGGFDSKDMQPGDEFRHNFAFPGTFDLECKYHAGAGMVMTIEVS